LHSEIICDITTNIRLVLDTDVVLSGLRSTIGASRIILLAIEEKVITPLASVATILEYEAVLKRPANLAATGLTRQDTDDFLDGFLAHADRVVTWWCLRPTVIDADDELFIDLARNGSADALVTFNLRDYGLIDPTAPATAPALGIPICRPGDFLRSFPWRPPAISPSASPLH